MRISLASILALAVLVLVPDVSISDPLEARGLSPAACIILNHDMGAFKETHRILEAGGARALHMFPPEVIFGRLPPDLGESDFSGLGIKIVRTSDGIGDLDPITGRIIQGLFNRKGILMDSAPVDYFTFRDVLVRVPEEVRRASRVKGGPRKGSPREIPVRSMEQNSEFLIGTVLVNIIFPESAGGSENWTDDELAAAVTDITIGTSQYQQYAHFAGLDFLYNYRDYTRIPVSIEPIDGGMHVDPVWMTEALENLGYGRGDYLTRAHILNSETREGFETDWVFTAFVVDASETICWQQADYVAYAYLGGPCLVVPYPACRFGDGIGFSHVFIHEMSHIFWALDEYESAGTPCAARAGYLSVETGNSYAILEGQSEPCGEGLPCIMNNEELSSPLPICKYTLGQVGLGDENENSVPDIYEVHPSIEFLDIPGVTSDTVFSMEHLAAAKVSNDAVPNKNPFQDQAARVDYAPWLTDGSYWLNNGFELELRPSDREWDESREDIGFIFSGLVPGINSLHLKVENCVGLRTEAETYIYYVGIKYYMVSAEAKSDLIDLSWKTAAEVFGAEFDLIREDLTAGGGEELIATIDTCESVGGGVMYFTYRDETVDAGHEYRYRIIARFELEFRGSMKSFVFPSNYIYETAMLPVGPNIVSNLMPNPTISRTSFTVNIPKSYYDPTGGTMASGDRRSLSAPVLTEVMTPVDIGVYNVNGQRIATIYSRSRFGGFKTFTWDGMDRRGLSVAPGVYFIRVNAGNETAVKKIVIIR